MKDKREFYTNLKEVDGQELPEINKLIGDYDFTRFVVKVSPSSDGYESGKLPVVVRIPHNVAGFPEDILSTPIRRTALEDLLTRKLSQAIQEQATFDDQGVARKRLIAPKPGQKILPRSTVQITDEHTDVRLSVMIPLHRDRIDGRAFQDVFFEDLPVVVQEALLYCNMDTQEVSSFIELMEDVDHIRQSLPSRGLVSFVSSGSMLAREPGSDAPDYESEQSLEVDADLKTNIDVPNHGEISGIGISAGVTVVLGDPFSGRIEFMQALASGIYNHHPGDGREYCVSMPDTVYVAAEQGRSVQRVDLGSFLGEEDYSTDSANACHSQVASLIEALEVGARVILLDESDSCAAFFGQDHRVQELLGGESRGASLAARVGSIAKELGVSMIVAGDSTVSSLIPSADTVLRIQDNVVSDITSEAKAKFADVPAPTAPPYDFTQLIETARWVIPSSIDASIGRRDGVIAVSEDGDITFGRYVMKISACHQLAEAQQALTIGLIIDYARERYLDQPRPIRELLDLIERDLSTEGLEHITRDLRGDLVRPRRYEIAAALNRLPSLRVSRAAI